MQAIITKYHGPSNVTGSRISAQAAAGKIFVSYDHALDLEGNHQAAARELVQKLGWTTDRGYTETLHTGCLPSGDYCHVMTAR